MPLIGDERNVLAQLREREAMLRALLDTAADGIVVIDQRGKILSFNRSAERILGYRASEVIGSNVRRLMPSPHSERHDDYLERYLATGEARVIGIGREVEARHRDGNLVPIDLSVSEVALDGETRYFAGILRDISDRKLRERRLIDALGEAEAERENLQSVLNLLRIAAIAIDERGQVDFANRAAEGICAERGAPMRGLHWEQLLGLPEREVELIRNWIHLPAEQRGKRTLDLPRPGGPLVCELEIQDDPRRPGGRLLLFYDVSELHRLREDLSGESRLHGIIGLSPPMRALFRRIREIAAVDSTVLIEGETGTGKELAARAVHRESPRRQGPFVAVNCAGLSESLLASQLFGHRRGAFTGAVADQRGVFEAAGGGTLFLDEIGDISPAVQVSLLRAIQEREITRLGDTTPRSVDVRIVVATNRDLEQLVSENRFRADLLYRIRVARVRMPALRERLEDLGALIAGFVAEWRTPVGRPLPTFGAEVLARFRSYSWPGNVRELRSTVEHALIHCGGPQVEIRHLPEELLQTATRPTPREEERSERERILSAIERCGGNRRRAAKELGVSRATLYRRLEELGIGKKRGGDLG